MKITFRRILNLLLYLSFCVMVGTGLLMAYRLKAAINGVPSLSILDGWWIEGCIEGVTGWAIDTSSNSGHPALLPQSLRLHRHDASRNRA
jgi:hypothetical protein